MNRILLKRARHISTGIMLMRTPSFICSADFTDVAIRMQPFDAYAFREKVLRAAGTKCDDMTDSFVPADVGRHGGLAEKVVHVGMADAGAGEFDEHFIGAWGRDWNTMSDLNAGVGAWGGEPGGGLGGFGGIHCSKVVWESECFW